MAEEQPITKAIHNVLSRYSAARPRDFNQNHPAAIALQDLVRRLRASPSLSPARPTLQVVASGETTWKQIPSIDFRDTAGTTSAQNELCVMLLFCADRSGVYLTLGQLSAGKKQQPTRATARKGRRIPETQPPVPGLVERGFHADGKLDLGAGTIGGPARQTATLYYKLFSTSTLPRDDELLSDLDALLEARRRRVGGPASSSLSARRTWIFQNDPALRDLEGLLHKLEKVTWLVQEHADIIHAGDPVYLWQPGADGGLLAKGDIVTEPEDIEEMREEKVFSRAPERSDGKRRRVRIDVTTVFTPAITAANLRAVPELSKLAILEQLTVTNFLVSAAAEATALDALAEGLEQAQMRVDRVPELIRAIDRRGFFFEPWQVATYVTALRTKPFVILAGVSGTGKSRLPALVSELTGGEKKLLPVRPDWTDSSDVLGYLDLQGEFRPGALLEFAKKAADLPTRYHVCIIDEMNLSRVEQYLAEVLSHIEDRTSVGGTGFASGPLLTQSLKGADRPWMDQGLPGNLAIVGTVNMDESAHGFSRKVIDRAFTLEISDIDLTRWEASEVSETTRDAARRLPLWSASAWQPRAIRLGALDPSPAERKIIKRVITVLTRLNGFLVRAQLQAGYRTRDEICLFMIHAEDSRSSFVTRKTDRAASVPVDPLDIALQMKILPRIAGGSSAVGDLILELLGWACGEAPYREAKDAEPLMSAWKHARRPASLADTGYLRNAGRPASLADNYYPRTAARLALMWERLQLEGYTSFWS